LASQDVEPFGYGTVDASGRAELWNVVPGKYRLTLAENDILSLSSNERVSKASPSAGPFEVKELASREKLATLEAVKSEMKRGTGMLHGRIRIDPLAAWGDVESGYSISLKIVGDAATAESDMIDPIESYWQPIDPPQVFGKVPENFKPHVPGTFDVAAL